MSALSSGVNDLRTIPVVFLEFKKEKEEKESTGKKVKKIMR